MPAAKGGRGVTYSGLREPRVGTENAAQAANGADGGAGGSGSGGGIFNAPGASLTVSASTF